MCMSVEALGNNFVKVSKGVESFWTPEMVEKIAKLKGSKINFVPLKPIGPMSKPFKIKHPALMAISIGTALTYGLGNLICNGVKKLDQAENERMNKLVYLS